MIRTGALQLTALTIGSMPRSRSADPTDVRRSVQKQKGRLQTSSVRITESIPVGERRTHAFCVALFGRNARYMKGLAALCKAIQDIPPWQLWVVYEGVVDSNIEALRGVPNVHLVSMGHTSQPDFECRFMWWRFLLCFDPEIVECMTCDADCLDLKRHIGLVELFRQKSASLGLVARKGAVHASNTDRLPYFMDCGITYMNMLTPGSRISVSKFLSLELIQQWYNAPGSKEYGADEIAFTKQVLGVIGEDWSGASVNRVHVEIDTHGKIRIPASRGRGNKRKVYLNRECNPRAGQDSLPSRRVHKPGFDKKEMDMLVGLKNPSHLSHYVYSPSVPLHPPPGTPSRIDVL